MIKRLVIWAWLAVCKSYLWVREVDGPNNAQAVRIFQKHTGNTPGDKASKWCMSFLAYCGHYGLQFLGGWKLPRTASCDIVLEFARRHNILFDTPEPGDLGLRMNPTNPNDATHTFAVDVVLTGGRFTTVEGNTGPDGGSDGDGVYERNRGTGDKQTYKFVRWINLYTLPQ